jgi:plasmid stabilization system protein ParE
VSKFELSQQALRDLNKIRRRYHLVASVRVADMVEEAIFDGIRECVRLPMIGHRRPDIRDRTILFHKVYEYAIVFRRQPEVFVVRIIHEKRDVPKRLGRP